MDEFRTLRKFFKNHSRAAAYLGLSPRRYRELRKNPEIISSTRKNQLNLMAEFVGKISTGEATDTPAGKNPT